MLQMDKNNKYIETMVDEYTLKPESHGRKTEKFKTFEKSQFCNRDFWTNTHSKSCLWNEFYLWKIEIFPYKCAHKDKPLYIIYILGNKQKKFLTYTKMF